MGKKTFGAALNCIDGRVQIPVINWMKKEFKLDYVDSITEPGMDGILASAEEKTIELVKEKAVISIKAHDSKIIAVVGHHDCAGNVADDEEHKKQIRLGVKLVESWNLGIPVVGLWVDKKFHVHLIK